MKVIVALFTRQIEYEMNTIELRGIRPLKYNAKVTLQLRQFLKQYVLFFFFHYNNGRFFYRLNKAVRWPLLFKAGVVSDPPVVNTKLNDLFSTIIGIEIHAEAPVDNKIITTAYLASLQKKRFAVYYFEMNGIQ